MNFDILNLIMYFYTEPSSVFWVAMYTVLIVYISLIIGIGGAYLVIKGYFPKGGLLAKIGLGTLFFSISMLTFNVLRAMDYTQYSEAEFNAKVIQAIPEFEGKATCDKNGIRLKGIYRYGNYIPRSKAPIDAYLTSENTCMINWYYQDKKIVTRFLNTMASEHRDNSYIQEQNTKK